MVKVVNEELLPPFEIEFGFNASTGLRTAVLKIHSGVSEKYVGIYKFREWTYGEKLGVELRSEQIRFQKVQRLNEGGNSDVQSEIERLENVDTESMIILQTLVTLREAPIKIKSIEEFKKLPGRVGTIFTNIAGYLNLTPNEEKKG